MSLDQEPVVGEHILFFWHGEPLTFPPVWYRIIVPSRWHKRMVRAIRKGRYPR